MKVEDTLDWQAFYCVARHASFTKAAAEMRCGVASVSKRLHRLEAALGVKLLQRSTRHVRMTREGEELMPRVEAVLADLLNLEAQLDRQGALSGTLRITCLPNLSRPFLAPLLARFAAEHPDLKIDVHLADQLIDLIDNQIDVAIRAHGRSNSSLVLRKLCPAHLKLCAAPAYLGRAGAVLQEPADLANHRLLMLTAHRKCRFQNSGSKLGDFFDQVKIQCEAGSFLTEMALEGYGIAVRAHWDVAQYLADGTLVEVLPGFPLEPYGHIFAAIPTRKFQSRRASVFLDFLLREAPKYLPS